MICDLDNYNYFKMPGSDLIVNFKKDEKLDKINYFIIEKLRDKNVDDSGFDVMDELFYLRDNYTNKIYEMLNFYFTYYPNLDTFFILEDVESYSDRAYLVFMKNPLIEHLFKLNIPLNEEEINFISGLNMKDAFSYSFNKISKRFEELNYSILVSFESINNDKNFYKIDELYKALIPVTDEKVIKNQIIEEKFY